MYDFVQGIDEKGMRRHSEKAYSQNREREEKQSINVLELLVHQMRSAMCGLQFTICNLTAI